ncbi:MAG: OB-fold nucleic acid binding domain-containing protein, partial [Candidatus Kapaibacteriota bacterium]
MESKGQIISRYKTYHYIENLDKYVGQEVTLRGWVYHKTGKGKLQFIQLRDGTGIVQCVVFKGNVSEEVFENAKDLTQESSVIIKGTVREDPRSPSGFEIDVTDLKVVQLTRDY